MILVLISDFMQDEIYLSEEIKHYHGFDKIIYFSVKGHIYSNAPLEITNGIVCGERNIFYSNAFDKAQKLCRGSMRLGVRNELYKMMKSKKLSSASVKSLLLFTAKSELLYEHIKKALHDAEVMSDERIVFYIYRFGIGVTAAAELTKIFKNSVIISRGHAQDIFAFRNNDNYLPYREKMLESVEGLYLISDSGKEYMLKEYPEYSDKYHISRLGTVDYGTNNNLGLSPFTILTCSRIVPIKRLTLLAKSLKYIDFELTWEHFGNGEQEYQEKIEEICRELPDNIKVVFHGFVDNNELRKIYTKEHASVFVNVSSSEGLPVSIMEACAAGIPVIATDVGGTREIVKNNMNGFLVSPDIDERELAAFISAFHELTDKEYLTMSKQARLIWEDRFSANNNYSHFADVLYSLASNQKKL